MTIISPEKHMANLWDWDILNGCFGSTRISPTDLDGLVEYRSRFLILEGKRGTKPLSKGQWIALKRMQEADGGKFTVLIIWGEPPRDVKKIAVMPGVPYPATNHDLRRLVRRWFKGQPLRWPK